jgi:hypothetical protein
MNFGPFGAHYPAKAMIELVKIIMTWPRFPLLTLSVRQASS